MSSTSANYFCKLLPIEALYYIFEYMTEKDQLSFALTCSWLYRVFRIYHVGYALPKWYPINITNDTNDNPDNPNKKDFSNVPTDNISRPAEEEIVPNAPPAANYRDSVLFNGKLYLTIFEEKSPICWILDFEVIPLNWKRVNVTFFEFDSDDNNESLEDEKLELVTEMETHYQPLRSTVAVAISSMIYFFGGESLTSEPIGILYELDPIKMVLKKVMGQRGDIPSARKMHSLNAIGTQCLVLFGGRCLMNDSDNSREYDTKEFHIYDISTKNWTMYRDSYDHVPYARCLHSTTVLEYTLYIYGGQQITSSTPESRIHDDDDLWCFTFNSSSEDSIDEGQNTPEESSTSSRSSNVSLSFQQEKWQKIFSPRNNTSLAFSSGLGGEWHTTTGNNVGRRCGAAMFNVGKRVAVLGGFERDNWNRDLDRHGEEERREIQQESNTNPWELCKLYLPNKKRWDQVKIAGFPEMECIAINLEHNGIFVMGRKRGDTEEHGITMGWIREEFCSS